VNFGLSRSQHLIQGQAYLHFDDSRTFVWHDGVRRRPISSRGTFDRGVAFSRLIFRVYDENSRANVRVFGVATDNKSTPRSLGVGIDDVDLYRVLVAIVANQDSLY
jgi:hypothetical protein